MARYSAGGKTSVSASTTLPLISLYSSTTSGPRIREIGVFNTTSTSLDIKLIRLTSLGTAATTLTIAKHDPDSPASTCTARNTHTANPGLGDDLGYRASLGAAVGAGVIWSFGDQGLRIAKDAGAPASGIGVIIETGSAQACQAYIVWDE